ncbi:MAG: CinA family nicotinamide mononucleotide deamidase-related protein [Methylococcales bacterium]
MKSKSPRAEIFSQGEEVVTGQTVDTNAAWLSQELVQMGFDVVRHTTVGDRMGELVSLLKEIADRADCCICTGGLGPTVDDLTAQAVSEAFFLPLQEDPEVLRQIESYFTCQGRAMPASNRKQALIPHGAKRLDNAWGTAPGFMLKNGRCWFVFVPGVPYEMRNLFKARIKTELSRRFQLAPWSLVTLRSVGIGESSIQEKLQAVSIPDEVVLSFCAGTQDIQTKFLFPPYFPGDEERRLVEKAAKEIGEFIFHIDRSGSGKGDLVSVIGKELTERRESLAVIETISGGQIASRCGAEEWFVGSKVIREVEQLLTELNLTVLDWLDEKCIRNAVEQAAMALREKTDVDYGLVQIWYGTRKILFDNEAAVPLYSALASPSGVSSDVRSASGDTHRKQSTAATVALDMLRRHLQIYPGTGS